MTTESVVLPDYQGGSLVNLMSSIRVALGGQPGLYSPLRDDPLRKLTQRKNLILLVIDGLGHHFLHEQGRGSGLQSHGAQRLTSVFPSTTASAITSLLTATAPQQHALPGWHCWLREAGCVAAVLPCRPRLGGPVLTEQGVDAGELYGHLSIFDQLDVQSYMFSPVAISESAYNVAHSGRARRCAYHDLEALLAGLVKRVHDQDGRQFIYAYYPEHDRLAHAHGIASAEVAEHFSALDRGIMRLFEELSGTDTTVVITADHGFIDAAANQRLELARHPALAQTLLLPLCGEPRAAYCYVKHGRRAQFEDYVQGQWAQWVDLYPSERLVEQGWFGLGAAHPALYERIGDYTLVMRGQATLTDQLLGETPANWIGVHGGVDPREMYVPLIVVEL